MADNLIGANGGVNLQALISNAQNNIAQASQPSEADNQSDQAVQAKILKQAMAKQQVAHDHLVKDHSRVQVRQAAIDKRLGPGVAEWATSDALQKKLTDKQKQMFLDRASQPQSRNQANAAGAALSDLAKSPNFSHAAPTAQGAGQLQSTLLDKPSAHGSLRQAVDSRFMGDRGGDRAAKEGFLRFAATHGDSRGISVRMGGDMLGTLSGAKLPGFAQRAAMKMMERNPDNVKGVNNLDAFVQDSAIRAMPSMARGHATDVLARADGTSEVREGLEDVAQDPKFREMSRGDKARVFNTIGQGRASELRAITDQTLLALQSANFPTQSAQVSRFLGGLGRQIQKGGGSAKEVDGPGLIRSAKRSGMPMPPKLVNTEEGTDEEQKQQARSFNRAAVLRYATQLGEHYEGIDSQIKNAKYFEDVNLLSGLRQAEPLDASALAVSAPVQAAYTQALGDLQERLQNRQLTRAEYVTQVKTVQTQAFGRSDLSTDEKTWVLAQTTHAQMGQTYLDLAGKKNRKLREVGKNLMPPAKRRRLAQERRSVGAQPRYFQPDAPGGTGSVARTGALPTPSQGRTQAGAPSVAAGYAAPTRAAAPAIAIAPGANAVAQAGAQAALARGPANAARMKEIISGLDPNLNSGEKIQQAIELIALEVQRQTVDMVSQMMQTLSQGMAQKAAHAQAVEPVSARPPKQASATLKGLIGQAQTGQAAQAPLAPTTQGKQDGWGIPRTFERDLGAVANTQPVRPAQATQGVGDDGFSEQEVAQVGGAEARILKPTTQLRDVETLYALPWKELSRGESAVFRNLGWDHATWDAKSQPGARWPASLQTPFAQLNPRQRASVQALGFRQSDWDSYVQTMGGKR